MSKKTLLVTLLIVILTASLAAAALYIKNNATQSQKESTISPFVEPKEIAPGTTPTEPSEIDTSNRKIYRNEEYRFEIKYLESWRIAYSIVEWRSKVAADLSYTPDIDDWLMITNLIQEEEKEYLEELD